jgi:type IV pilus assembly protein PilA
VLLDASERGRFDLLRHAIRRPRSPRVAPRIRTRRSGWNGPADWGQEIAQIPPFGVCIRYSQFLIVFFVAYSNTDPAASTTPLLNGTQPVMSIATALKARREQMSDREAGFTLIELLVVVIIIGILAAIAIPVYIGVQNNAKNTQAQSDLTNAKTAYSAYVSQNSKKPADLSPTLNNSGYTPSTYASTGAAPSIVSGAADGSTFCLTAKSDTGQSYYVTNASPVSTTVCT